MSINYGMEKMTICLGINFGDFALLVADSRVTIGVQSAGNVSYVDDQKKVFETKIGLITGSGSVPLLDSVKNQLASKEVTSPEDIIEVINEARYKYAESYIHGTMNLLQIVPQQIMAQESTVSPIAKAYDTIEHDIRFTRWMMTYVGHKNGNSELFLGFIDPSLSERIVHIPKNNHCVIYPYGMETKDTEKVQSVLEKIVKSSKDLLTMDEYIEYNISFMAPIIRVIHQTVPSISDSFQVGVHPLEGLPLISEVIHANDSNFILRPIKTESNTKG